MSLFPCIYFSVSLDVRSVRVVHSSDLSEVALRLIICHRIQSYITRKIRETVSRRRNTRISERSERSNKPGSPHQNDIKRLILSHQARRMSNVTSFGVKARLTVLDSKAEMRAEERCSDEYLPVVFEANVTSLYCMGK